MKTVCELRRAGFKVRVNHYRDYLGLTVRKFQVAKEDWRDVSAKGGYVRVEITPPDGLNTTSGVAKCSRKDNYNYRVGLNIALGRALQNLTYK